ncbi:MAG: tyrosine--tRNA ligase [Nitrospirae bacterium]|nr:tyrosine--tRNA ligase [Nitrospirota bacterium]MDA1304489.1 tyrosine--tRNA ligase [Nitrospirota bacterium]
MPNTELTRQLDLIRRGTIEIIQEQELETRLTASIKEGRPLRIKAGFDPTAPDLHIGHMVLIQKLRHFQELGHEVIFLIGDFTGIIGDPTGRSDTRKALTKEEVLSNAKTYERQIFKILDPDKTRIEFNSRWMQKMGAEEMVDLCSHYSVARMLERDDFSKRYRDQKPIHVHEFLYPLVQGYDSVVLKADVELGGTDQKFNLLVGRDLQRAFGQTPQVVITMPLLEGTDGVRKMSKSLGNYIALEDPPGDMFGKVMSISDELMFRYYELLTSNNLDEVKQQHPMEAKIALAEQIVSRYHGLEGAQQGKEEFQQKFRKREFPDEPDATVILKKEDFKNPATPSMGVVDLIMRTGLTPSKGETRRLITQGALTINNERYQDANAIIEFQDGNDYQMKIGKRKYALVKVEIS